MYLFLNVPVCSRDSLYSNRGYNLQYRIEMTHHWLIQINHDLEKRGDDSECLFVAKPNSSIVKTAIGTSQAVDKIASNNCCWSNSNWQSSCCKMAVLYCRLSSWRCCSRWRYTTDGIGTFNDIMASYQRYSLKRPRFTSNPSLKISYQIFRYHKANVRGRMETRIRALQNISRIWRGKNILDSNIFYHVILRFIPNWLLMDSNLFIIWNGVIEIGAVESVSHLCSHWFTFSPGVAFLPNLKNDASD